MTEDHRTTNVTEQPEQRPNLFREVYPLKLVLAEKRLIDERRNQKRLQDSTTDPEPATLDHETEESVPSLPSDAVGMAFSGGGIRSATFCLGFLNSMARYNFLDKVDFLSTVSGGGYVGSFLGGLFTRRQDKDRVRADLMDKRSFPLRWLRENGRYLAPNSSGDLLVALSAQIRNWIAVLIVMGLFCMTFFLGANALRAWLESGVWSQDFIESHFHLLVKVQFWWWSPYIWLPAVPGVIGVIVGWAYFLIPRLQVKWFKWPWWGPVIVVAICFGLRLWLRPETIGVYAEPIIVVGSIASLALILWLLPWCWARWSRREDGKKTTAIEDIRWQRRWLSAGFFRVLEIALVLLLFALVDSLGQSLYLRWQEEGFRVMLKTLMAASGLSTLLSLGPSLSGLARWLPKSNSGKFPLHVLAMVVSIVLLGLFFVNLNFIGHAVAWNWTWPHRCPQPQMTGLFALMIGALVCLILSWFCGQYFPFLHGSSLQVLYGSRLARAYLGASNKKREDPENQSVTDMIPGDDIYLTEYEPYKYGGPLHLINLTFNET